MTSPGRFQGLAAAVAKRKGKKELSALGLEGQWGGSALPPTGALRWESAAAALGKGCDSADTQPLRWKP